MSQTVSSTSLMRVTKRFAPLGILALALIAFFATGLHKQLSFDAIAINYGQLTTLVEANPILAPLAMLLIYAAATALSFPAAWLITVTAGLVFGWQLASLIVVFGATIGACVLFLAARYALRDFFQSRAKGVLAKMADGFAEDATSFMLFLRLAPIFPFTLINVVPGILGVSLFTFAWTTFVGIIPGVIAYTFAGEGLRSIVGVRAEACAADIAPCGTPLSAGDLVTTQILIAFVLLAIVSLLPIVLKRLRRSRGR